MDVEPLKTGGDEVLELEGVAADGVVGVSVEKRVDVVDDLVDVGLKGGSGRVGAGTDLGLDVVEVEWLGNGFCVPFILEKPGKELSQPLDGRDVA